MIQYAIKLAELVLKSYGYRGVGPVSTQCKHTQQNSDRDIAKSKEAPKVKINYNC